MPAKRKTVKKAAPAAKTRKPYPNRTERIAAAGKDIARLEALNAARRELIAKSEKKLEERKAALARTEAQLAKVIAKKKRLVELEENPTGAAKARRTAQKAQMKELAAAIKASGKSLDEILASIH